MNFLFFGRIADIGLEFMMKRASAGARAASKSLQVLYTTYRYSSKSMCLMFHGIDCQRGCTECPCLGDE